MTDFSDLFKKTSFVHHDGKQIEPYFWDLHGAHILKSNSLELIFTEQTCLLS